MRRHSHKSSVLPNVGPGIKGSMIKGSKKGSRVPSWSTAKHAAREREPGETTSQEMSKTIFSEGTILE